MGWLGDHLWAAWLCLAIVLGVAEMLSLDLILLMLAVGAVVGGLAALVGTPFLVQALLAAGASAAMLSLARPNLIRHLHTGPDLRLGHGKLVGERAVVTSDVSALAPGLVRLAGEDWTAQPYDESLTIPAGATVEVFEIRGATAYVHPLTELGP
ncbi:MAG: NfeD family protein [Nocardioides sp.]